MVFPPVLTYPLDSVGLISFVRSVAGQLQESLFQARAADFKARESGIPRQQFANDRLRLDGVNLNRFAIFFHLRDPWNLAQGVQIEAGDAANPLARGLRLDLRRSSLGDDLSLINDGNAVGQRVSLLQVMRRQQHRLAAID